MDESTVTGPLFVQGPLRASAIRRAMGWLVDYLVIVVPGAALVVLALAGMLHSLPAYVGGVAAEVGWGHLVRLIFHRGADVEGFRSAASGEWIYFAAPLIGAFLLIPVVQFLYHACCLGWRGRTLGKTIADARVISSDGSDSVADAASKPRRPNALKARWATGSADIRGVSTDYDRHHRCWAT